MANYETIKNNIVLDFNNFQPTDTEGWEMEGSVNYEGKDYSVELDGQSHLSFEEQAASQIATALATA